MHLSSSHACYIPCPFHHPWLGRSNYIWRRVQVMKHLSFSVVFVNNNNNNSINNTTILPDWRTWLHYGNAFCGL
jgi:hypothetical protein